MNEQGMREPAATDPDPSSAGSSAVDETTVPDPLAQLERSGIGAVALLLASVAAPFLKGLVTGLALAGAAAAVSEVFAAGRI